MRLQALIILFVLIGCQKPKPENQIAATASATKTNEIAAKQESFLKTDTISISEDVETYKSNYALAHLLDQKTDKDSVVTAKYRLDFYENKTKTASTNLTIKGIEKESEWGIIYGLNTETEKSSPFIQIRYGYPACGYMQNNYLYYLKNGDVQLVHEWYNISDSGWGNWVEFKNPTSKDTPESFYCKTVSFEPDDNDENMGTVKHSDSIVFRLSGNRWKSQLLSAKDKSYFEKRMSFDEFHKQE
jgi:hypothetical protein